MQLDELIKRLKIDAEWVLNFRKEAGMSGVDRMEKFDADSLKTDFPEMTYIFLDFPKKKDDMFIWESGYKQIFYDLEHKRVNEETFRRVAYLLAFY